MALHLHHVTPDVALIAALVEALRGARDHVERVQAVITDRYRLGDGSLLASGQEAIDRIDAALAKAGE